MQIQDNFPVIKYRDYDKSSHEFFIRDIKDIRERAGKQLSVPKRLDFYKIVYVTGGEGCHKVDFYNVRLKPQSLLPIGSNVVQCFMNAKELEGFVIHFSHNFFIKETENYNYLFKFNSFSSSVFNCSPDQAFILNQIKIIYDNRSSEDRYEQIINYLRVLLFDLEEKKRNQDHHLTGTSEQLFCKFQKAIEKNITYRTKVKDVCQCMRVDAKRLNPVLKNAVGKSAKELIDERLILEIKRLLIYSNLSAKEIAFKLKFDEPANMSNYFKRRTRHTPLEFRCRRKQSQFL